MTMRAEQLTDTEYAAAEKAALDVATERFDTKCRTDTPTLRAQFRGITDEQIEGIQKAFGVGMTDTRELKAYVARMADPKANLKAAPPPRTRGYTSPLDTEASRKEKGERVDQADVVERFDIEGSTDHLDENDPVDRAKLDMLARARDASRMDANITGPRETTAPRQSGPARVQHHNFDGPAPDVDKAKAEHDERMANLATAPNEWSNPWAR